MLCVLCLLHHVDYDFLPHGEHSERKVTPVATCYSLCETQGVKFLYLLRLAKYACELPSPCYWFTSMSILAGGDPLYSNVLYSSKTETFNLISNSVH